MAAMQPIPTDYKGVLFRSRLEASWAEYFDFELICWSYEPEGFRLSNGANYLPDFYLPNIDMFVECRGTMQRSLRKSALFAKDSGRSMLLALPEGRFYVCTHAHTDEPGRTTEYVEALFSGDPNRIQWFQANRSSLRRTDDDAVEGRTATFSNWGEMCDVYVGRPPEYFETMKDTSRADGGDTRSYYWGGLSTWAQRGFRPTRWHA